MTSPELGRYLDYCSELLSVTSKLAALLVQYFNDEVLGNYVLPACPWLRTFESLTGFPGRFVEREFVPPYSSSEKRIVW